MRILSRILASPLFKNLLSLSAIKGFDYVVPLILIPFLFRTLGVEMFGLVYFAQAFIGYFMAFTQFGFNFYTTHYIASNISDAQKTREAFWSVVFAKLGFAAAAFAAMSAIVFRFETFHAHREVYFLYFGIVAGEALFPSWFFQAVEKMKFITYITLSTRTLTMVPMFFVVRGPEDVWIPPLCYSLGSLLSGAVGIAVAHIKFGMAFRFAGIGQIWKHIRGSSPFALVNLCNTLQAESGTFLLELVGGNAATGVYSAARKLVDAYNAVIQPIQIAMYPYMIKRKNLELFWKIFFAASAASAVFATIAIAFAPLIIDLFYNTPSREIINAMRIIMLKSYATIPAILLGFPLIGAIKSNSIVIKTSVRTSAFYICLVFGLYFCGAISVYSVAAAAALAEYALLSQRLFIIRGGEFRAK